MPSIHSLTGKTSSLYIHQQLDQNPDLQLTYPHSRLKIVADSKFVDPEFGTGAVKLTPAHDPNDYQMGKTHGLEFINILNDDGTLNANAGRFEGQRRFDARYTVVEELTKLGLFVKKEPNPMKIPLCEKSKDVIEPIIKPQWWMQMQDMADAALKVVESGEVKISPESANKSYRRWMASINDWCISRQLWQVSSYQGVVLFLLTLVAGGVIESQHTVWCSRARTLPRATTLSGLWEEPQKRRRRRLLPNTVPKSFTWSKTLTVLTPGSALGCGPCPPWDGPTLRVRISSSSSLPAFSRLDGIFCSSG